MNTEKITISLPPPSKQLSPNASGCGRSHWPRTRARKKYRDISCLMAKVALHSRRPLATRATVEYQAFWKDRRSLRDQDNLIATMKPALDGLVDAGLLADDKGVTILPPVQGAGATTPRVEIVVEYEVDDNSP